MKILMGMNVPYTRVHGGANRSNRALLEGLAARGHQVCVVTPALASPSDLTYAQWRDDLSDSGIDVLHADDSDTFALANVSVIAVGDPGRIRSVFVEAIASQSPEWILVASEDPSQRLLSAGLEGRARVAYLALTPQLFPFGPESLYPGAERTRLVQRCALICCLSQDTADYIREHAGVTAHVYTPPHFGPGPFPHFKNFGRGSVLLMNGAMVKGLPIFERLARGFPAVPFALLRGYASTSDELLRVAALPNVEIWPNRDSLDDIFRQTRVLLMPSLWRESFGLAALDAMLRGIPVLASNIGALPEATLGVGNVLPVQPVQGYTDELAENLLPRPVVPEQDIEPWTECLEALLAGRSIYEAQSAAGRTAALRFAATASVEGFEALLEREAAPPTLYATAVQTPPAIRPQLSAEQKRLLLRRLEQKRERPSGASTVRRIERVERRPGLPLSFAQERLFFLEQLYPGTALYNCPMAFRICGDLDVASLQRAANALLDRHEVLRTVFEVVDGRPVQRIAEHLEVEAPLVDLGGDAEMLPDLLAREAARPFDLSHGPLVRLNVFRVSDLEYVLLLNMHHIVTDAWSGGVLLDDLFALYTQFRRGRLNVAPGPALQYVDYAAWQRRTLDQHALEADLDYWRSALMGAPPVLDISLTGRSPSGGPHTGRSRSFAISSDVMTELRGIARGQNATLFATLLAAFSVLLYRLTGRTDIVVGAPVANRHPPETESIVGFFVNTLPLRVTVEPHSPFRAHVRRAQNVSLDGLAHQQAPFEKIVEALAPEHSLSYAPIFQVLFGVRDAQAPPAVDGLSVQSLDVHSGTSKFDLNMELLDTGETLEGSVEFDTSLFSPEMVDNLLTAWTQLLSAIAANPDAQPGEVELLDAHLRQTFNSYMRGPVEPPGSDTVLSLFRSQVERSPDAPAVQSGATSLTYRQLNERANQVAHRLIDLGAGPERTVALCVRRSPEMVVAVLAAMKTGAAYVPLDPAYPTERLESMLTQSAPAALLASPELAPRFAHLGVKTMLVEPGETLAADIRVDDPEVSIAPDNLAYILFTSGSTGQPKGVQLPHRALVNLLEWHARHTPPTARTLQFASLGFDLSFHEIFSALIAGACVYVVSDEERRELPRLPRLIAERQVDKVMLSAGMLQEIARSYEEQSGPRLPVKVLASTAEQLKITPALQRFVQNLGDVVLRNDYGPTETHVATSAILSVHGELAQGEPPIGRPLDNCRAYVLDHLGNPVVPGYAGELYLAGACLARGYHLHPDLTAERFLPDPLGDQPGERMYRTGDLVRCDADGNLFYLGRIDRQLKIRGMRVEPAEIEAVLHTVPGIDEALVIPTEVAGGSTQLVAYLATHLESEAAISAAQRAVAEQLPDYMRPSAWACLPAFPLTPNGKINRSDLPPAASVGSVVPEHDDERPRTDIEQRLCRIWGEVLELEQVGIRSSFFSLGGHSLRMIQIASRVRSEFGVEISMQSFFEGPTIAEQAVVVTSELALRRSPDSVDALLDQVANLPEDQVQSLLAGIQAGVTGAMVDAVVKGTAAVANMAVNIGQVTADASVNFAMASTAHFQSRAERLADLLTRSANQPSSSARISAIGVPSSNRPASLAECLTSYAGNLQEFDRRVDVVVCSDPQDAAMDREYREVLQRLQKQTGLRCWYAGVEDKRAYAERLSRRADVPQELAEFALFGDHRQGTTYGANRNALLLHHAGVAFLSVDDDTSAQLHDPPTPASPVGGIDFCSEDGVSEVRVVVDRNEALALVRPTHVDVVEMHETVLGARVPDVFARTAHGQLPGLDRLDAAVDASILNGRVVASYNGWLGFSGWRSPVDALFLEGASWRWLTRSEDAYMRSLNSTEQVRFVPRLTITRSPEFFVVSGAFDVRSLLPPFIPVYRREDIMFGLLLKRSSDEACFAHLPAMVTHGTPRSRFSLAREAFDFADLIDAGSAGWTAPSEATVSHRLEQLGRHLEDIGRLDSHDFENWIDTAVRPRVLAHLDEIEQRVMACPPERDFWARDMRHLLNVSRRSIAARGLKPLGSTQRSGENAWAPFQDTLARAGQLIAHWPAMLSEARALRQQEIFLAQPVVA